MRKRLPPGPINFNASFGLTWRHYWKMRTNPITFATEMSNQYGDVSFFRVFKHRVFLINHPSLIHQVLVTESENFPKFDRIRNHLREATGDGLLVTQGEVWRKQRLNTQKIFRSSRIGVFGELTSRYTSEMLSRWQNSSNVQIEHEMTALIQAIMGEGFFGMQLRDSNRIANAVRVISDIFHDESQGMFNLPDWLPLRSKRKKVASLKLLRDSLTSVVKGRLASGKRRDDFLDMLLHSSANESNHAPESTIVESVMSQLLTMYMAGFHTTSVALTWLMFAVARYQDVQQKVREEVQLVCGGEPPEMRHVSDLKYTQMVVKESLRIYPASWELFARQSIQESEIDGYRVPEKSLVLIMPVVTHRDPRFFPDPLKFDPQRFSASREQEIPPFAWIPFGAGPNACIGKSMALMQMTQVLAAVVQKIELKLDENNAQKITMVPKVSLRPSTDIKIMINPLKTGPSTSTKEAHSILDK